MQTPPLEPTVAEMAPTDPRLVGYDYAHMRTYLRLLDAAAAGAAWEEVALAILGIDAANEPERAFQVHRTHFARAVWMSRHGYRELLKPCP